MKVDALFDMNGRYLGKTALRKNASLFAELTSRINSEFRTVDEVVWSVLNQKDRPSCEVCHSEVNFVNVNAGYRRFCSSSCVTIGTSAKRKNTMSDRYGVEYALQSDSIKKEMCARNIEKYGVEHTFQVEKFHQTGMSTKIEKYGSLESAEKAAQLKREETNLTRYGNKCVLMNEEVNSKARATMNEKYGVDYSWQSPEIYGKILNTMSDRYGVTNPSQIEENRLAISERALPAAIDRLSLLGWKFNEIERTWTHSCGNVEQRLIHDGSCKTCQRRSKPQMKIKSFLDDLGISYYENDRKTIAPYELDFKLTDTLAIEVNGIYWHSDEKPGISLLKKSEMFNGLMLHFWDFEIDEKFEIVKSMIKSKLKMTDKIHARKTKVRTISKTEAKKFLEESHINGYAQATFCYGLFSDDELVAVATFRRPRFGKDADYELIRFASKLNVTVVGGLTKLVNKFKQHEKCDSLISFADRRFSNSGAAYGNVGFELVTETSPNYFYFKSGDLIPRYKAMKHKLADLLENFDDGKSEYANMRDNGYLRCFDCGSYKFILRGE